MKAFILSFGDSDKYIVPFDGTREEFEKSEELKHIEDRLYDSIKEKFPGKLCKNLLQPKIEDYDTHKGTYPVLDDDNLKKLKDNMERQMEVRAGYENLDKNARFDDIN